MENKLPNSWAVTNLESIADWASGGTPKSTEPSYYGGDIPWLIIGDLNDGDITSSQKTITTAGLENSSAKMVPVGAVLCAMYGSIGKLGITTMPCATNQAIAFTEKIHGGISNKYLFYYLFSIKKYLLDLGKGGTQQNISQSVLKQVTIPIAPLAEQQRIVAKLDEVMEKIDRSRARLESIPKILKRFRQSVLSAAVSGKLTAEWRSRNKTESQIVSSNKYSINKDYKFMFGLPEGWKWVALGNYVNCNRGRFSIRPRNDPRYFGGKIPFIQIGDLPREGGLINRHSQTLNEQGLKVSKMFPKNTIAIAIVGATIGNTGILDYDMCFTDSMVGINTGHLNANLFVDYYLRSEKENLRQLSYAGGGQPNIKLELLNAYPFPLPPVEEQNEVVKKVKLLFAIADKIEARYINAKEQIDKIPQSILAKAFRGELVWQDENDEPASELLKRILSKGSRVQSSSSRKTSAKHSKKILVTTT